MPGARASTGAASRCGSSVPGAHNALNAAAALEAAGSRARTRRRPPPRCTDFQGAGRRFELLGATAAGAAVYDDYAHHPTEVAATVAAARTLAPRRVVAVFQPHLYSRTRALARGLRRALAAADVVVVLDVYPARERPEDFPGVDGKLIADAAADAANGRTVAWLPSFDDAERVPARPCCATATCASSMGAGDVDELGRRLVAAVMGPTLPAGRPARLPARAPHDRSHGRARRVLRASGERGAARRAAGVGAGRRPRGRGRRLGVEPAGSGRGRPRTRDEARQGPCADRTGRHAAALRRRRAPAGRLRACGERGPDRDRVRREHPRHGRRGRADERERLRRRARARARAGRGRDGRGRRAPHARPARLRLPQIEARTRRGRRRAPPSSSRPRRSSR